MNDSSSSPPAHHVPAHCILLYRSTRSASLASGPKIQRDKESVSKHRKCGKVIPTNEYQYGTSEVIQKVGIANGR